MANLMTGNLSNDVRILRELARQYAELVHQPVQEERRWLWTAHFSLKKTRPPVLVRFGIWNFWRR